MSALLEQPTLVLNRNWQPVNVATVARALTLVCNQAACVVDPADYQLYTWSDWSRLAPADGESFIQAVRARFRVPEVIVLTHFDRVPKREVSFSRRNLYQRDGWTCQYCAGRPGGEGLSIDHVLPRSRGGGSTWENCVLACLDCNKRKADRTPAEARMHLRRLPARPAWKPLYARHHRPLKSWSRFISEAYWNVTLAE